MKMVDILRTIRFTGLRNPLRAVRYAILRDLIDRRWIAIHKRAEAASWGPGKLQAAHPIPQGARFEFERAKLEALFLDQDVLRITWDNGPLPVPYAIAPEEWPGAQTHLREMPHGWVLASDQFRLEVSGEGALRFFDVAGEMIREDLPPAFQGQAHSLRTHLPTQAHLYGLGERAAGLNLRPGRYRLWNRDPGGSYAPGADPLYICIPAYICLHPAGSYLIFFENSFEGEAIFEVQAEIHFSGGALRYYLIPGSPAHAISRYARLTGKPPLPPRWALGFHQSRWSYADETQVQEILCRSDELGLPLSAIHLDIDYMDAFRVFTVNRRRFPNLRVLAEEAASHGVRLVTILDPGVKVDRGYRLYREGLQRDAFCRLPDGRPARAVVWPGWSLFPDFSAPQVRAWWASQYRGLLRQGIAGIWHDMNEPSSFTAWGEPTLPLSTQHALEGQGGDHTQAHNLYGLLMNRAGFEALRAARPDRRPFLLSRSGWAGAQRYAWFWTGDIESSWDALKLSLTTMLGMSLSGLPFVGTDIGGFSGNPSPELMVRWFQMAALTPFFRVHSARGTTRRELWTFEQPWREALRKALELRYGLMPYLYTLAWQASHQGLPLMRPLFWADPANETLWEIENEFLLGENLLVAPCLQPGQKQRSVHLPAGTWIDFWDGEAHEGPGAITLDTPLNRVPMLVRSGVILPMEQNGLLALHVFAVPDTSGTSLLYSDAGDGYGPWRLDRFSLSSSDEGLVLDWETEGEFSFPQEEVEIAFHGSPPHEALVDGTSAAIENARLRCRPFKRLEARFAC